MQPDPGWKFTWRSLAAAFVPQYAVHRAANEPGANVLAVTRQLFLAYCLSLIAITVVVFFLSGVVEPEDPRAALAAGVVAAVGILSLIAGRMMKRRLDCSSDDALAASYHTRFSLRVAFAQSVALIGFTFAIALGPWWVYFLGLGFAAVGMFRLAPTRRHLEIEQNELAANGCHRSLTRALAKQAPTTGR